MEQCCFPRTIYKTKRVWHLIFCSFFIHQENQMSDFCGLNRIIFSCRAFIAFIKQKLIRLCLLNIVCNNIFSERSLLFMKPTLLTDEGLRKLEFELEELKTKKRKEIAEKIKVARSFGDLSENSEYDEAKNDQAIVEERIATLEKMLRNVKILDEEELTTDQVNIGSKVKLYDTEFDEEVDYQIVGSTEVDPTHGKISDESPIGSALLKKRVNDIVEVNVPSGTIHFKILEIGK